MKKNRKIKLNKKKLNKNQKINNQMSKIIIINPIKNEHLNFLINIIKSIFFNLYM